MRILVLIPAKDEESKISEVVKSVKAESYEVLVIDDGSKDKTAVLAREAGAKVISHSLNRGQGASIKTGIRYALDFNYEAVVFFDADGQMRADEIKLLVSKLENGEAEVILGSRFKGKAINIDLSKLITLKLGLIFTKLTTGLRLSDTHNGFQAWSAGALKKIHLSQDRQAYASELLEEIAVKKIKYLEVPVTISYSAYSKKKGQSIFNSFNIIFDLIFKK